MTTTDPVMLNQQLPDPGQPVQPTPVFAPQAVVFPPARIPNIEQPLVGSIVQLRALTEADLPELYQAIAHPEVFSTGWGGGLANYRADYAGWKEFMLGYLRLGDPLTNVYAVCLRREGNPIVGTSSLGDFDLKHAGAMIGWTAFSPETWGVGVNAEAKYLMLGAGFSHGLERIRIQADAENTRSRAAIERLGAVYEGTLRHTRRRGDGSWSNSAVYSILSAEWPDVRQRLESRIMRHLGH